jgi:hypothetical protein
MHAVIDAHDIAARDRVPPPRDVAHLVAVADQHVDRVESLSYA